MADDETTTRKPPPEGMEYDDRGCLVFAKGNRHGENTTSLAKKMHAAFRRKIGVQGVEELAEQAMQIAMSPNEKPADRLKAMEIVMKYAVPGQTLQSAQFEEKADGSRKVTFTVVDAQGNEQQLLAGNDDGNG